MKAEKKSFIKNWLHWFSRISGNTSTICLEFIFHSPYNRYYSFSSAVLGETRQRIRGRGFMYCIKNVLPDFLPVFYCGIFLSTGTDADIYKWKVADRSRNPLSADCKLVILIYGIFADLSLYYEKQRQDSQKHPIWFFRADLEYPVKCYPYIWPVRISPYGD